MRSAKCAANCSASVRSAWRDKGAAGKVSGAFMVGSMCWLDEPYRMPSVVSKCMVSVLVVGPTLDAMNADGSLSPRSVPGASAETRGLWLGLLGVAIFALTLPMTRLAVGPADAPQLPPLFVTAGRAALARC